MILRLVHVFCRSCPRATRKNRPPLLELAPSVYRRSQPCLKGEQAEKYANCCLYPARFTFFPEGTPLLSRATAIAILAVAILLILVPCGVLFFAIGPEAVSQHLHPSQLPVACWAVWALVSLWAALDSSRLWRVLGRPVDPLGPQALYGVLLGALNIGGRPAGCDVAFFALRSGADPSRSRGKISA